MPTVVRGFCPVVLRSALAHRLRPREEKLEVSPLRSAHLSTCASVEMTAFGFDAFALHAWDSLDSRAPRIHDSRRSAVST